MARRLRAVQCGAAPLHAAGREVGVPTLSRSVPAPGCVRSPGIDVSPERIGGRACPTRHRLARLSGHLTTSRPVQTTFVSASPDRPQAQLAGTLLASLVGVRSTRQIARSCYSE